MSKNIIQGLVLSNIQTEFKDFEISFRHFSKFISCSVADFESLFLVKVKRVQRTLNSFTAVSGEFQRGRETTLQREKEADVIGFKF